MSSDRPAYHEDDALVELVAEALYERAMSERRAFSGEVRGFSAKWAGMSESVKHGWRVQAVHDLGGSWPEDYEAGDDDAEAQTNDRPAARMPLHRRYEHHDPKNPDCRYTTNIGAASPDADWCSCPMPSAKSYVSSWCGLGRDECSYEPRCDVHRLIDALREIGLPTHVPSHFDPLDYWKHTACKRGEIARDALGVTAEELIRDAVA